MSNEFPLQIRIAQLLSTATVLDSKAAVRMSDEIMKLINGPTLTSQDSALWAIRAAGHNTTDWAIWAQKMAAWGLEPAKWPRPSEAAPPMDSKPQARIFLDSSTGEISISAFRVDSDQYETNHTLLVEMRNGKPNKHESVLNIVRNVLVQCGVSVIFD